MKAAKPEWIAALRALTGQERDDIRWNEIVGRWEFILTESDGVPRSRFFGWFYDPQTGIPWASDEFTGKFPFRELDDAAMREVLANMERTYIGNRWDGAGSKRKDALRKMRANRALHASRRWKVAEAWADMVMERSKRLRGALTLAVPGTVTDALTPKGAP